MVGAILGRWFQKAASEARPFSFGGKALSRMDEGEISDNGNIVYIYMSFCAFIIPPFISNL